MGGTRVLVRQGAAVEMRGFGAVALWRGGAMGDPLLRHWSGATVSWPFGQLILSPGATATLQGLWDQAGDSLNSSSGGR